MKKFVIETNQNYIEVMKRILSDCDVSGNLQPEIETYLDESKGKSKLYKCDISGNRLYIEMKMPYRNSFASTMDLELLISENKTRINGSINSILDGNFLPKMFSILILIGSFGLLLMQTIRYAKEKFQLFDWVTVAVAVVVFLSVLPFAFGNQKQKTQAGAADPYGVQMGNWISNLFPGECRVLEK